MVDDSHAGVVAIRPGPGGALVIAIGVAAWVPFAFLLLGLVLTDGSYWSFLFSMAGLFGAWLRALRVAVWREGDTLTVRNFHSTRILPVRSTTVLRPFSHWAQPNFDCLAVHTPGEQMWQVHATAAAQRQWRREEETPRIARAGHPISGKRVGTWQQLRRRW